MSTATLLDSLESIRRRAKLLAVLYGVGLLVAAVVAALVATVFLDWALNLPAWPRVVVIAAALGGVGYAAWRWVVQPIRRRLSIGDVAGHLEGAFPQFDDRLRSAVSFAGEGEGESSAMKRRVMTEAAEIAGRVDLNRAVVARPAVQSIAGGVGAAVVVLTLAAVTLSPATWSIIGRRLLTPFAAPAWPKRVQIDVLGAGPSRVAAGDRVPVTVRLARGDSASVRPVVYSRVGDGPVQQQFLERGADGTYAAALDARLDGGPTAPGGAMSVWVVAGDDRVDLSTVSIVPRLEVQSADLTVSPPPYAAGLSPTTVDLSRRPAVVGEGSALSLRVGFNKPLAAGTSAVRLEAAGDDGAVPDYAASVDPASPAAATLAFAADRSSRFRVAATDADGFGNLGLGEYQVTVRPDAVPSIQIEQPRRSEDRTANAVVPLRASAEDDYGLRYVRLVVVKLGETPQTWTVPLVDGDAASAGVTWTAESAEDGARRRFRLDYGWELAQLAGADLKPGDVLEYFLTTQDNFDLAGRTHEPVESGHLRVSIISPEQLTKDAINDVREVKEQLGLVQSNQAGTRQQAADLRDDLQKREFDDATKAALDRLVDRQSSAAATAKQLADKAESIGKRLDENRSDNADLKQLTAGVKAALDDAADDPMRRATTALDQSARPDGSKERRDENLKEATDQQQKASEKLDAAQALMDNIGTLQTTIGKVSALLEKQRNAAKQSRAAGEGKLGKTPEQMSKEDREKLDDAADAQEKLADETDALAKEMKELSEQLAESDPQTAEAMREASRQAESQQVSQNQRKAADAGRKNQQAQSQQQQQQVELGLETVLNQLKEAEKRKLAALQRKVAELAEQVATLIRRQAGHNLDTLSLGGGKSAEATVADLREKAARPADAPDAPAVAADVTAGQAQTERNARDLGKSAEEEQSLADAAARLTRAAGQMEQAVVKLRADQPADAYDPLQVAALDALVGAQEQLNKRDEEIRKQDADRQKEAVKKQYEQIRADQVALNGLTAKTDADGGPRKAVAVAGLSPTQGGLAERVDALGEPLEAVGSVVYIWANRDLAGRMNGVKARLNDGDGGPGVRDEQGRIVAQLDSMIEQLRLQLEQPEFEDAPNPGGGGGGGVQASALPPAVELHLMKQLQLTDNQQTIDAAKRMLADGKADPNETLRLGQRQGEFRDLLDQLVQKASKGENKLGPEPDPRDRLPEEAAGAAGGPADPAAIAKKLDDAELTDDLLGGGAPPADAGPGGDDPATKALQRAGDRMGRARQRLALDNDPGPTTQLLQKLVADDLDALIEQAKSQTRAQQQQDKSKGGQPQQPQVAEAQPQNQGAPIGAQVEGKDAAQDSNAAGPPGGAADPSAELRASAQDWGNLPPRAREAIVEAATEQPVEAYKGLSEDYFRGLAEKATER